MGTKPDELERLAQAGDTEAQIAFGRHFESEQKCSHARAWYAKAAKQGSVPALRLLAISLLTKTPIVARDGVNMIRSAAHKGDAEAAYVCALLAAQDEGLEDRWAVARQCLEHAAERNWQPAAEQLAFLGKIGALEDPAAFVAPAHLRELSPSARVAAVEKFASDDICDWIITHARPHIGRAFVYDRAGGGGRIEQARTNSAVTFDLVRSDLIVMMLRARIAATSGLPSDGLEATVVLHYAPGEEFETHVDFLDPSVPGYAEDLRVSGQRTATFLLYLNGDYDGGETDFPEIGVRYKGRKGDALLFRNVLPDGRPDERMRHAGLPPTSGEKWLLSQWIRQRTF
jgi:prolyl 4-hydroxylase